MHLDQATKLRDEISAMILREVAGDYDAEHEAVNVAAKQLEQFGCMGGSTRSKAEAEIVRLVQEFDDTQDSSFGPWPVSDFMATIRAKEAAYAQALKACITAHKAGKYEPMVAAIDAAENLIKNLSS